MNQPQPPKPEPDKDCQLCPRLVALRKNNQSSYPGWFNGAVPAFGNRQAAVLIVGLAPGLKGANRTGRPFTGDYAGDLHYPTLIKFGLAAGRYNADPADGIELKNCRITNAVRCVPPQNKPIGAEIRNCENFLKNEIASLANLKVIISLGRIAHQQIIRTFEGRQADYKFAHGAVHHGLSPDSKTAPTLINSYHCSRYNTNTGRLTEEMFDTVFEKACRVLETQNPQIP